MSRLRLELLCHFRAARACGPAPSSLASVGRLTRLRRPCLELPLAIRAALVSAPLSCHTRALPAPPSSTRYRNGLALPFRPFPYHPDLPRLGFLQLCSGQHPSSRLVEPPVAIVEPPPWPVSKSPLLVVFEPASPPKLPVLWLVSSSCL